MKKNNSKQTSDKDTLAGCHIVELYKIEMHQVEAVAEYSIQEIGM